MKLKDIHYCAKCGKKLSYSVITGLYYCVNNECDIKTNIITKKPRDKFEIWLDKHNHKLSFIRTVGNFLTGLVALLVILGVHTQ